MNSPAAPGTEVGGDARTAAVHTVVVAVLVHIEAAASELAALAEAVLDGTVHAGPVVVGVVAEAGAELLSRALVRMMCRTFALRHFAFHILYRTYFLSLKINTTLIIHNLFINTRAICVYLPYICHLMIAH